MKYKGLRSIWIEMGGSLLLKNTFFKFTPQLETTVVFGVFIVSVLANVFANLFHGILFNLFYQGVFGIGICISFPLWYTVVIRKEPIRNIGLTTNGWLKALLIAFIFIAISIPGQMIGKVIPFPMWDKFIYISIALIMSTLFEELFFRGFLQTKFEKAFGIIPAIILSGLAFSLYHLGYPRYRSIGLLITLFLVGVFFAISFSFTKNVLTSFAVNLPNAILTYILHPNQFVDFNREVAVISAITTMVALGLIVLFKTKEKANLPTLKASFLEDSNKETL